MKKTNVAVIVMVDGKIDYEKGWYTNVSSIGIHKDFTVIGYTNDKGEFDTVVIDHADNVYISPIIGTDEYLVKRMLEEE